MLSLKQRRRGRARGSWPDLVGDEASDRLDDGLLSAGEKPMVGAVKFDEPGSLYMARQEPASLDAHGAVQTAMQHQRGRRNARQKRSHIHVAHGVEHSLERARARG